MTSCVVKTLDIWAHVEPRFGGVGPAAARLATEIGRSPGWSSTLVAVCDRQERELAASIPESVHRLYLRGIRPISDATLSRDLRDIVSESDVCHIHGVWLPHAIAARRIAHSLGKPILCSAHGMLEKWDLANKRIKKGIYAWLLERPSLSVSTCLRALSGKEADDYRHFGLRNPIAIIPTGVDTLQRTDVGPLFERFPHLSDKRIVLYLSRVHYKKGVLRLIEAWPAVIRDDPSAHLLIIGGDYDGTTQRAQQLITNSGISASVTLAGAVSDRLKQAALSASKFFCLPSYSEGLSAAVLEALSIGLPVVITRECNVDGVDAAGAGMVTTNVPDELAATLLRCLALPESTWETMGNAARNLAHSQFDWSGLATKMQAVYEWVQGGPKPEVVFDR